MELCTLLQVRQQACQAIVGDKRAEFIQCDQSIQGAWILVVQHAQLCARVGEGLLSATEGGQRTGALLVAFRPEDFTSDEIYPNWTGGKRK